MLWPGIFTARVTRHRDLLRAIRRDGLTDEREAILRHELDLAMPELDATGADPHPSLRLDRGAVMAFLSSVYG